MKYSTAISAALMVASGLAKNVACRVGGVQQSVVDLETGVCPFALPASLPVNFKFTDIEDYLVDAYYVLADTKYFNDIAAEGKTIAIPAKALYGKGALPLFHIHAEAGSVSNSTNSSLARRFNTLLDKRDAPQSFIDYIKSLTGTAADSSADFSVSDPDTTTGGSGSGSGSTETGSGEEGNGVVTVTDVHSTLVTITSCSDHKCTKATVPATWGPVTTTLEGGVVTVYTTWCPETEEPATATASTITITITSCSDNKCTKATVPATFGPVTTTLEGGDVTVYTTWCPVTETTTVTGVVPPAQSTFETGVVPPAQSTFETVGTSTNGTATAAVSTAFNGAAKIGGSALALVALPLAYLL